MDSTGFGNHLKALRESINISIRQLSLISGISISYISQLENGKRGIPKPCILKKLAPHLNVSYENLMAAAGYIKQEPHDDGSTAAGDEDIERMLQKAIDYIQNKKGLMLNGKPLDDLGRAVLRQSIEFGLSYAKENSKHA